MAPACLLGYSTLGARLHNRSCVPAGLGAALSRQAPVRSSVVLRCAVPTLATEATVQTAPAGAKSGEELARWRDEGLPQSQGDTGWASLTQPLLWQGNEHDALQATAPTSDLAPAWRMMLLSNGSVTRHLELLTGAKIEVECLEMQDIGSDAPGLPEATTLLQGPLVQRQVLLCSSKEGASGKRDVLVYASSWWPANTVDVYLEDKALPIWKSLAAGRTELYRDIRTVSFGDSEFLQKELGHPGPFWGRQYIFWSGQRPLTLIHEVFSPELQRYLGPIQTKP